MEFLSSMALAKNANQGTDESKGAGKCHDRNCLRAVKQENVLQRLFFSYLYSCSDMTIDIPDIIAIPLL